MKEQMTLAEYKAWQAQQGGQKPTSSGQNGKYRNKPVVVDGIRFLSTGEANYYGKLKWRKQLGDINDFFTDVSFVIHNDDGSPMVTYWPDFVVLHNDDSWEVIDIKGGKKSISDDFKLKAKMVLNQYDMEVVCIDSHTWKKISYLPKSLLNAKQKPS